MSNISFVYFDIGGVMLLDFSGTNKWTEMKRALGVTPEQDDAFDQVWKTYRSQICIDCDVDTISAELASAVGVTLDDSYSMLADFVDRFDKNPSMWQVAEKAKSGLPVGLLTNMYPRMLDTIKGAELLPELEWDAVVDSSIVGFQKPEPGIFEVAEKMAQVNPEQIFFVDNSEKHVEAARERGWQTLLYDPQNPEESSKRIEEYLGL